MALERASVVPLLVRVYRSAPAALATLAERGVSRGVLTMLAVLLDIPAGTRDLGLASRATLTPVGFTVTTVTGCSRSPA